MTTRAVFLPKRENYLNAVREAIYVPHSADCKLYSDGERMAWLPKRLAGWFLVGINAELCGSPLGDSERTPG